MIKIGDIVSWVKKGKKYTGKVIAINPANESLVEMEFGVPCSRLNYVFEADYDRAVVSVMSGKGNNLESIYAPAIASLKTEDGTRQYEVEGFVNGKHRKGIFNEPTIKEALDKAIEKGYDDIILIKQA